MPPIHTFIVCLVLAFSLDVFSYSIDVAVRFNKKPRSHCISKAGEQSISGVSANRRRNSGKVPFYLTNHIRLIHPIIYKSFKKLNMFAIALILESSSFEQNLQ